MLVQRHLRRAVFLTALTLLFLFLFSLVCLSSASAHRFSQLQQWKKRFQQQFSGFRYRRVTKATVKQLRRRVWRTLFRASAQTPSFPVFPLILNCKRRLTPAEVREFERKGVHFRRVRGELLRYQTTYVAKISSFEALHFLETHKVLRRVEADRGNGLHLPLNVTVRSVQGIATHRTTHKQTMIRGKGVLIGLLDSGINVFHPQFFRADGGLFSWIDVNGDQKFTPCVDAVDFNRNGKADSGESLCCIQARIYNFTQTAPIDLDPTVSCRAGIDWLYQDKNGNKIRDYGPRKGFGEKDPTFGEQLFVIDDINRNGTLDVHEKIVALKTSKIRATYIAGKEGRRGENLINTLLDRDPEHSAYHGTATASVLVGGQPGYSHHLGVAPDAELIVAVGRYYSNGDRFDTTLDGAIWLQKKKPALILYEFGSWVSEYMDGSSTLEKMMTEMGANGIIQVVPAGNLGGSQKHMKTTLEPGQTIQRSLRVQVPGLDPSEPTNYSVFFSTFLWKKNSNLKFTLRLPSGKKVKLEDATDLVIDKGVMMDVTWMTSSRGTVRMDFDAYGFREENGQTYYNHLPVGDWVLEIKNESTHKIELHGYVSDNVSNWGVGVRFVQDVSNQNLITWPGTADDTIGVGAYTGRDQAPYNHTPAERAGKLRSYSSRGPRFDGKPMLTVVAPDNPIVAATPTDLSTGVWISHGHYLVYGGTSGAGPHAAGAVALLKQLYPDWNHARIHKALSTGSLKDEDVGIAPNHKWGYGKLRIYKTIYGTNPKPNRPPKLTYSGPKRFVMGHLPKEIKVAVDDFEQSGDEITVLWDVGYKGDWQAQVSPLVCKFPLDKPGTVVVRVKATDSEGMSSSLLIPVTVVGCNNNKDCRDGFRCNSRSICDKKPAPKPAKEPTELPDKPLDTGCQCNATQEERTGGWALLVLLLWVQRRHRR